MTTNGDGVRGRLIAELEARLVALSQTHEACWRQARDLAPILTSLRMGTLSATLAVAMLADKGIGVRDA